MKKLAIYILRLIAQPKQITQSAYVAISIHALENVSKSADKIPLYDSLSVVAFELGLYKESIAAARAAEELYRADSAQLDFQRLLNTNSGEGK